MINPKHFQTEGTVLTKYTGPAGPVEIPEGITVIGDSAFWEQKNITSVTMPDSVTEIQSHAFYGCSDLYTVRFSQNLRSIHAHAFDACVNLKSVEIPESVMLLGNLAFVDCHNLSRVKVSEALVYNSPRCFAGCRKLADEKGFVILHNVICDYYGPGGDVVIPDGIIIVAPWAFYSIDDSKRLTSVVIPGSVKTIGDSACLSDKLTSVTIEEGLCTIGKNAFRGAALTTVRIPSTVTVMEQEVFALCPLQTIEMNPAIFSQWSWTDIPNASLGIAVRDGENWRFYGYCAKTYDDSFTVFVHRGKWNAYDLELINNGPTYRFKAPARLLGALGRLVDPVELTDECKELHLEFLIKNAKKLIPIAEQLRCPAIVEAMKEHGIINDKNKKAIAKLLAASQVPEIAAVAL